MKQKRGASIQRELRDHLLQGVISQTSQARPESIMVSCRRLTQVGIRMSTPIWGRKLELSAYVLPWRLEPSKCTMDFLSLI